MNTFLSILLVSALLCFTRAGELKVEHLPKFLSVASHNGKTLTISNVVNTLLILLGVSPETTNENVETWLYTNNALIAPKSTWILHVEGIDHFTKSGYSILDGEDFNIGRIQSKLSLSNSNKVVAIRTIYVTSESDWNNLDEMLKTQTSTIDKDAAVKYIVVICEACSSEDSGEKMGKQIEKTLEQIAKDDPEAFTVALATKETARVRRARSTQAEIANITIATMYSDEYPTMFNLFFWISLVLALIVISIVYVFLTLDPGSDTIIYRMTTPRLKVD